MQQTSLEAYHNLENIGAKQSQVLALITEHKGLCLFELEKLTGWPVNRITGRVNELVKMGLVEASGDRRLNPETNKNAIVWQIKEDK
jgi:predicted transcriptional regulator